MGSSKPLLSWPHTKPGVDYDGTSEIGLQSNRLAYATANFKKDYKLISPAPETIQKRQAVSNKQGVSGMRDWYANRV